MMWELSQMDIIGPIYEHIYNLKSWYYFISKMLGQNNENTWLCEPKYAENF